MATLSGKVFKHHKKTDGTFNVKVCIHHNNKRVYMDTEHYVADKKLDKNLKIKDTTVNRILYVLLDEYREAISLLGVKVDLMTVDDIKAYLLKRNEKVDLLAFGQIHIDHLESQSRKKSASTYRTLRGNENILQGGHDRCQLMTGVLGDDNVCYGNNTGCLLPLESLAHGIFFEVWCLKIPRMFGIYTTSTPLKTRFLKIVANVC